MTEPGQTSETKNPCFSSGDDDEIVESDIELDNTDVVEPDDDPSQKVFVEMFDLNMPFVSFCWVERTLVYAIILNHQRLPFNSDG